MLESLVHSRKGLYVDCTFGAGGHSSRILEELNKDGKLLSMDKDKNATKLLSKEFIKDSTALKTDESIGYYATDYICQLYLSNKP